MLGSKGQEHGMEQKLTSEGAWEMYSHWYNLEITLIPLGSKPDGPFSIVITRGLAESRKRIFSTYPHSYSREKAVEKLRRLFELVLKHGEMQTSNKQPPPNPLTAELVERIIERFSRSPLTFVNTFNIGGVATNL